MEKGCGQVINMLNGLHQTHLMLVAAQKNDVPCGLSKTLVFGGS
jgi:hypothetical protein